MTDLRGVDLYIDPDGIIGHYPDCTNRIDGGTLETGPPKFAASCCIDVAPGPDPRFRTFEPPAPVYGSGEPMRRDDEDEASVEDMEAWLSDLGRKCIPSDMTPDRLKAVERWLKGYTGDFEFLLDIRAKGRRLTEGQAKGVANCWRADIFRRPKAVAPPVQGGAPSVGLDLSEVPSGKYSVPGGDTRLKVKLDNVDRGNWSGWVFVKDAAEYGAGEKYGSQKPGALYRGKIEDELKIIASDPKAASIAYGMLTGSCGRCGRKLEDEASVAAGIGPVCAQKGW